jgi:hypothetical protein
MDDKLKAIEDNLLLTDKNYKLTREQSKNWIRYAVVIDIPAGMPWEGLDKKKQKQGTSNTRLAYVLHVHQPDHKQKKTLLANEKDKNRHKIWGNSTFTIKTPDEREPKGVKTKYIQMVQTQGSVQLSMGAATIKGMIDVDTVFDLRLLPRADGKPRPPTKTLVKENFIMMELHGKRSGSAFPRTQSEQQLATSQA